MADRISTAELVQLTRELSPLVGALDQRIDEILARMVQLEKAGLIQATEHWRKGGGEPKYMYLLHPQKPGVRRWREYIGADPVRIAQARAGIVRAGEHAQLPGRAVKLANDVRTVTENLRVAKQHIANAMR